MASTRARSPEPASALPGARLGGGLPGEMTPGNPLGLNQNKHPHRATGAAWRHRPCARARGDC